MDPVLEQAKIRHLSQLAQLPLPPSTGYERPSPEIVTATHDDVKAWIKESGPQIKAAITACGQGSSPDSIDWNVARLAFLESASMYFRKNETILKAREAFLDRNNILAFKLYDEAQEDIVELARLMGLKWMQLYDMVQYHPDKDSRPIDLINTELNSLVAQLSEHQVPVYTTGHSLGAAYATYMQAELTRMPIARVAPIDLHTFGSPRTGTDFAKELRRQLRNHSWRVVNGTGDYQDVVTTVPPTEPLGIPFIHVDSGIQINWDSYTITAMASEVDAGKPLVINTVLGTENHDTDRYYEAIKRQS